MAQLLSPWKTAGGWSIDYVSDAKDNFCSTLLSTLQEVQEYHIIRATP